MKFPSDTRMEVLGLFCGRTLETFLSNVRSHIPRGVPESFLVTSKMQ